MGAITHYISLRQPWASLLVGGAKRIETRGWPTRFRGLLAVHAGKTFGLDEVSACHRPVFGQALDRLGFAKPSMLPLGAVIGWVEIVDCLRMTAEPHGRRLDGLFSVNEIDPDPRLTTREEAFGNYEPFRYAWITNPLGAGRPAEPIPMRALQRIQKLPPEIAARLAS